MVSVELTINEYWKKINTLVSLGKYLEAVTDLNFCIRQYPSDSAYYLRGCLKESELHDKRGAALDFDSALALTKTDSSKILFAKGMLFPVRDYRREQCLIMAMKADSTSEAVLRLAEVEFVKGNYDNAKTLLTRWVSTTPPSNPLFYLGYENRGHVNYKEANYDSALADFNQCLKFENRAFMCSYYRGLIKQRKGDSTGACEDFKMAAEWGVYRADSLLREKCR